MSLLKTYTCPHNILPDERCPHCEGYVGEDGQKIGRVINIKLPNSKPFALHGEYISNRIVLLKDIVSDLKVANG